MDAPCSAASDLWGSSASWVQVRDWDQKWSENIRESSESSADPGPAAEKPHHPFCKHHKRPDFLAVNFRSQHSSGSWAGPGSTLWPFVLWDQRPSVGFSHRSQRRNLVFPQLSLISWISFKRRQTFRLWQSQRVCPCLSLAAACWSTTARTWTRRRFTAPCGASPRPSRTSASAARKTWWSRWGGTASVTARWGPSSKHFIPRVLTAYLRLWGHLSSVQCRSVLRLWPAPRRRTHRPGQQDVTAEHAFAALLRRAALPGLQPVQLHGRHQHAGQGVPERDAVRGRRGAAAGRWDSPTGSRRNIALICASTRLQPESFSSQAAGRNVWKTNSCAPKASQVRLLWNKLRFTSLSSGSDTSAQQINDLGAASVYRLVDLSCLTPTHWADEPDVY